MTDIAPATSTTSSPPADSHPSPQETWLRRLGHHVRTLRHRYPDQTLCVVFDIDGTIIDTRHLVLSVLLDYDRSTGTDHFRHLTVADIDVHEADVAPLLARFPLDDHERSRVQSHYDAAMWTPELTLAAHQPYRGVMEVIRWFQLQPHIEVALNTGRPESLRAPTLRALSTLADEYRVHFPSELLFMNHRPHGTGVTDGKVEALRAIRADGRRIAAVIDNEPENLEAMATADDDGEILFMHASTIFLSAVRPVPRSVTGNEYLIHDLISPADVAGHVTLVAADIDRRQRMVAALREPIGWMSVPVRLDPYHAVELDTDGTIEPWDHLDLDELLSHLRRDDRALRLDLRSRDLVGPVLEAAARHHFDDHQLWFDGAIEVLEEDGIRMLRGAHPDATISCRVDFLAPLMSAALEQALDTLELLRTWGVDRLSISWSQPRVRRLLSQLESWGYEVDVIDTPDLVSTLEAAVLLPRSVTSRALVPTDV